MNDPEEQLLLKILEKMLIKHKVVGYNNEK